MGLTPNTRAVLASKVTLVQSACGEKVQMLVGNLSTIFCGIVMMVVLGGALIESLYEHALIVSGRTEWCMIVNRVARVALLAGLMPIILMMNICTATMDVAVDGLALDVLNGENELGWGKCVNLVPHVNRDFATQIPAAPATQQQDV